MITALKGLDLVKETQPHLRYRTNFQSIAVYHVAAAAAAKSLQSCPTLCDPIDGSPPGSPIPGILQARTLKWVAISFSNAWKWKVKVKSLSRVWLLAIPWTAAHQAPPSMGFSRQEYWSGVPVPSPKDATAVFNSRPPKLEFLSHAGKQQTRGTISHTKKARMSQSFIGGQGLFTSLWAKGTLAHGSGGWGQAGLPEAGHYVEL